MNRTALVSSALLLSVSLNAGLLALAQREATREPDPAPAAVPAPPPPAPAPQPLPPLIRFETAPEMPILLDATPRLQLQPNLELGTIVVTSSFDRNDRLRSRALG